MTNTTCRPSSSTLLSILNSTTDYSNLSMDQVSIGWGMSLKAAEAARSARGAAVHANRAARLVEAAANRGFTLMRCYDGSPSFERSPEGPRTEPWITLAAR